MLIIPIIRGGVYIYYKESLPVRVISLPHLNQAFFLEMTDNSKQVIVSVIYHCRNQNNSEFELFLSNFEQFLNDVNKIKPSLYVITGDFNADLYNGLMTSIQQRNWNFSHSHHQINCFHEINQHIYKQTVLRVMIWFLLLKQIYTQIVHSSFNLNICYTHYTNAKYGITKRLLQLT